MINIWTPDLVPELKRSGGQALAAGVASAGQGIGGLVKGIIDAQDRKKREGDLATSMRKTLSLIDPERKSEFATMGLPDLQGEHQAIAVRNYLAEQKSQQDERASTTALNKQALAAHIAAAEVPSAILSADDAAAATAAAGMRAPMNNEAFDAAVAAQSRLLSPEARTTIGGYAKARSPLPPGMVDDLVKPRSNTLGPDALKALGLVINGGQMNPNGSVGLTYGLPAPVPGEVPPNLFPKTANVNAKGEVSTTYGTPDSTDAQKTLLSNATEMATQLQAFEDTVKKYGNFEYVSPEGSAALGQLPYQTAILYSKIVDPATAAREGEVAAAQKYMIPTGLTTRNSTTLAALENQKKELGRRISASYEQTGQLPPNLPEPFVKKYLPAKVADAYAKQGNAVTAAAPKAQRGGLAPSDARSALAAQAHQAIAAGKDAGAVKARFKQLTGIDLE